MKKYFLMGIVFLISLSNSTGVMAHIDHPCDKVLLHAKSPEYQINMFLCLQDDDELYFVKQNQGDKTNEYAFPVSLDDFSLTKITMKDANSISVDFKGPSNVPLKIISYDISGIKESKLYIGDVLEEENADNVSLLESDIIINTKAIITLLEK